MAPPPSQVGMFFLARVPMHHSPEVHHAGLVSVGCNIYAIGVGEPIKNVPSSNAWMLDCRSHTWHKIPSMRLKWWYPTANVLDGKIYVAKGYFPDMAEIFDPKTQTWDRTALNPPVYLNFSHIDMSLVIDGVTDMYLTEFDSVMYMGSNWTKLNGLEGLPKFDFYGFIELVDYGGKISVFWDKNESSSGYENIVIWCAVISLEKRANQEIWGEVEWCEQVLAVPKSYGFLKALDVTV